MQARWFWLLPVAVVASAVGAAVWFGTPGEPGMPVRGGGESTAVSRSTKPESDQSSDLGKASQSSGADGPAELRVAVVARHAHDPGAFTQGLVWHAGKVYETTGLHGQSRLRRWNLGSGEIEQETPLPEYLFGEGLAVVGSGDAGELVWLTWKAGRALRFDLNDFAVVGEFSYQGEGWGLALCNGQLYRSDGTSTLWRHDPETFSVRGRFEVSREGVAVRFLNELECTPRGLLANVWQRDEIVRIDPMSGRVTATIDAGGLLDPEERRLGSVLNGIAYRPETDTLLITGKYWPWLFEVVLEEA